MARAPWQIGLTLTLHRARAIPKAVARGLSIFCLLAVFLALWSPTVYSAPTVQVRDRVDIELGPVTRVGGLAQFRGRIVQRAGGEGVANSMVRLEVGSEEIFVETDATGNFSVRARLPEGEHLLTVDFEGDQSLDPAHFEMADFDITRIPVALALEMPSTLADDATELLAQVSATTESGSQSLLVEVFFGEGDKVPTKIQALQLDAQGKASFVLGQQVLGGPGQKRVEVRYAGSEEFDAAMASKNIIVAQTSELTLKTNREQYSYGDTIVATGRLLDGRGDAIQDAVISLEISSQSIGQTKSDERGDYVLQIDTDEIGSGTSALQAQYDPHQANAEPSLSKPVQITIGDRKPVPIAYTVTAFALASFALLSFVTLRTKPWQRWQRTKPEEKDEGKGESALNAPPLVTGFIPGRRKLRSTIGRASYNDFHGRVRNVIDSTGIEGARIVVASHREQELRSDAEGRFAISELSEGEYKITVIAEGFVSEHFSVQMPHRGDFHDSLVELLPVREKIFSLYKYAVRSSLPDPQLWGIWTPRQILEHVRKASPSVRLSALTDFVEESFFSQRIPSEEKIDLTRAMIRGLDEDRKGAGLQR